MFGYKNILVGVGAIALATTPSLLLSNTAFINNTYNKTAHNNKKPRKN
ncbi:hypothetical protein M1770_04850 [Spiroplasma citri]|nr:hypothetical protein [Spiroplasma citri]WFG97390.1 hypothetical protein M1770_04850 [Spiroplasma citri]